MNRSNIKIAPLFIYSKTLRKLKTFSFMGKKYHYFNNSYNNTWANERSVEIPIIMNVVRENKGKKILEVGNVLSNYFIFDHDTLDKYEISHGVINQDVVDFKPSKKYDLIVSVSTLEHVGWDETPKDETKIVRAIENLKKIVTAGGMIVVTLPIGYNPNLDKVLKDRIIQFDKQYYMLKISTGNEWKETSWEEACDAKYNFPFSGTNSLIIGFIYG